MLHRTAQVISENTNSLRIERIIDINGPRADCVWFCHVEIFHFQSCISESRTLHHRISWNFYGFDLKTSILALVVQFPKCMVWADNAILKG